jgi:ferredoxin
MKIKFLNSNNKEFETEQSEISLIEVCRKIRAPINFGCRIGICGTCKVQVSGNLNNLSEKNAAELEFTTLANERLACQCIVKGDLCVEQPITRTDERSSLAVDREVL